MVTTLSPPPLTTTAIKRTKRRNTNNNDDDYNDDNRNKLSDKQPLGSICKISSTKTNHKNCKMEEIPGPLYETTETRNGWPGLLVEEFV